MRRVLLLLFCLLTAVPAMAAAPSPTPELYVRDDAGILTESTKGMILAESAALDKASGAQLAVLVVKSLGGQDIFTYSLETAASWKLGDAKKNNGLLIALAVEERKIQVQVGRGLEGCLPDAKVGRLIDSRAIPFFKENKFDEGLRALYGAIDDVVRAEYGLPAREGSAADAAASSDDDGEWWEIASGLALLFLPILAIAGVFLILCGMVFDLAGRKYFPEKRAKIVPEGRTAIVRWFITGMRLFSSGSRGHHRSGGGWGSGSGGTSGGGGSFGGGGAGRSF